MVPLTLTRNFHVAEKPLKFPQNLLLRPRALSGGIREVRDYVSISVLKGFLLLPWKIIKAELQSSPSSPAPRHFKHSGRVKFVMRRARWRRPESEERWWRRFTCCGIRLSRGSNDAFPGTNDKDVFESDPGDKRDRNGCPVECACLRARLDREAPSAGSGLISPEIFIGTLIGQ